MGKKKRDAGPELPPGVKLLRAIEGHMDLVFSVAFDPQGRALASGSRDDTVKLWETRSGTLLRTLKGHKHTVWSVAFDPQGGTLASGSDDNTVKLWETRSGKLLRTLAGHPNTVNSVAFDPQGGTLASGSDDHTVKLWEPSSGQLLHTLEGHQRWVSSVAFDPQGLALANGSADNTVKLWETRSGQLLRTLEGHTARIDRVAFSPDGRLLASKSGDHTIRLWSCATWETVAVIPEPTGPGWWIPALAFHPTLPLLAAAGSEPDTREHERGRLIHVWELDLDVLLGLKRAGAGRRRAKPISTDEHYRNAKVVLVGNSSVGKSGLGLVLAGRKFRATESTHGRHIWSMDRSVGQPSGHPPRAKSKRGGSRGLDPLNEDNGMVSETRETLLWDLAGQPAYRLVHQLHLSEVAVALVLFDAQNEVEPFNGVGYWARALDDARREFPLKKFLVAARCDRGGTPVSQARIDEVVKKYGFDGYFQTSAKRGDGVADLQAALCEAIQWDEIPAVTRTVEFQDTKNFLLEQKRRGTIVATVEELLAGLKRRRSKRVEITDAVLQTCLGQLEATGLIRRLPFGDWVLLQPELLDDYSGWLTLAAREEPDGLGYLSEKTARSGKFPMDKDRPLATRSKEEETLLLASVEEVLNRGLAIREYDEKHREDVLVFPTELKSKLEGYPEGYSQVMTFRFSGPVRGIYASLVVKLIYSIPFQKHGLYRNAAIFTGPGQTKCGVAVDLPDSEDDSLGRLTVFFDHDTREDTRKLFLRYVNKQVEDMAFKDSTQRERIYHCGPCSYTIDTKLVELARKRKNATVTCGLCNRKYPLDDLIEQSMQAGPDLDALDQQAKAGQRREAHFTTFEERRRRHEFDVFLCHNSKDKPAVRELAQDLADEGILAWVDEKKLRAGDVTQEKLEQAIHEANAIAVCIGPNGLGRWQTVEYHTVYERFIDASEEDDRGGFRTSDRLRIIPVLLPGATPKDIPRFLKRHIYADLRSGETNKRREEMRNLVEAILSVETRGMRLA